MQTCAHIMHSLYLDILNKQLKGYGTQAYSVQSLRNHSGLVAAVYSYPLGWIRRLHALRVG